VSEQAKFGPASRPHLGGEQAAFITIVVAELQSPIAAFAAGLDEFRTSNSPSMASNRACLVVATNQS